MFKMQQMSNLKYQSIWYKIKSFVRSQPWTIICYLIVGGIMVWDLLINWRKMGSAAYLLIFLLIFVVLKLIGKT